MAKSNFYRRNLPHWQPAYAEYFVTFRLKNSIPSNIIQQLKENKSAFKKDSKEVIEKSEMERQIFARYERMLDHGNTGPTWLAKPQIANVIVEALHHRDQLKYDLYAFCVMPNHVHVVFKLLEESDNDFPVTKILTSLKSYTALQANKALGRSGAFWQGESYDRVIRDQDELENTIKYILNNPVKAGLVNDWKDWKYTYCKAEFLS